MNQFLQVFRQVLGEFEKAQIDYMVVGSIASTMYGEPRMTRDLDLVTQLHATDCLRLPQLFPQPDYYLPPAEILAQEVINRGYFNILHIPSGLKVDCVLRKLSPHASSEFSRKRRLEFAKDFSVWVASVEDVIIKKLEFYQEGKSSKHLVDIRGMLANTPHDSDYLQGWISRLNLGEVWQLV